MQATFCNDRCWCVDYAGATTASTALTRFYFKENGVRLTCAIRPGRAQRPTEHSLVDAFGMNLANVSSSWPLVGPGGSQMGRGPAVISLASARRNQIPTDKLQELIDAD